MLNYSEYEKVIVQPISFRYNFHTNIHVLRLDRLHPVISGNKWFKLKHYLEEAQLLQKKYLLTFGGAYSNHIAATAAAAKKYGFESIGVIRGEAPKMRSHTLTDAMHHGMHLVFTSREAYKQKLIPKEVTEKFPSDQVYIIPEGGSGALGRRGATEIMQLVAESYTHVLTAVGTGTTAAGIAAAEESARVIGISVLKQHYELESHVLNWLPDDKKNKFTLFHDYHFGGYAKFTPELIAWMNAFYESTGIPTDFVYTGKLFFAVEDLIRKHYFAAGSRILVIHSGGLQGNRSLPNGTLIF